MHLTNDFDKLHAPGAGPLPTRIKPFQLVEQGACFTGTISLKHMDRLEESLISRQGQAQVVLRFARHANGVSSIAGDVRVRLALECQRCLQPMAKAIAHSFELALARSEAEARQLEAEHEVLELVEDAIAVKELVEDELLLAIPLAPSHEDPGDCDATMLKRLNDDADGNVPGASRRSPQNPFAVLEGLKGLKET